MSESATQRGDRRVGWYVYGVTSTDAEVDAEVRGVGDPPAEVLSVRYGEVAALASEIRVDRRLGTPQDLMAHEQVLDSAAAGYPVLPMRFGAVVGSAEAVADELLAAHHDEFSEALRQLGDRAQYVVHGRYVEDAVLTTVLSRNEEAVRLRESIGDRPEDASRPERIQLGEIVDRAIEAMRNEDTQRMRRVVEPLAAAVSERDPSHEFDAVNVAVLLERGREAELEEAVGGVAEEWSGRIQLRLLGPLATYDFTVAPQDGG